MSDEQLDLFAERWLPVVGLEGTYEVSDLGNVRSLDRTIGHGNRTRSAFGCVLKPRIGTSGYPQVYLDGKTKSVHRLVLEAFVGRCPPGMECLHGNDIPTTTG